MSRQIAAAFKRGGTSRGLFFSASSLAPYDQVDRDKIICQAMGSPDPGGRQIDGLGGGISSLSKMAIISKPGGRSVAIARKCGIPLPGVDWADDPNLFKDKEKGWDAVYRFGQVPIRETTEVDYSSTCGNLVAAAAHFAIESGAVEEEVIHSRYLEESNSNGHDTKTQSNEFQYSFPLRLLAANIGKTLVVKVPMIARHLSGGSSSNVLKWSLATQGTARIAGVPGTGPAILVEDPLDESLILPTSNPIDTLEVDGQKVDVTVINAGLATIFVSSSTPYLELSQELLLSQPSIIDGSPLMSKLQRIREEVCRTTPNLNLSPSAPKICLVSPKLSYLSTEGVQVEEKEMDCLIRAVSVGNIHRTIPATCLAALACGLAFPKSTIYQAVVQSGSKAIQGKDGSFTIAVGQPSGVSSCSISTKENENGGLVPKAVQMLRTARTIMTGTVSVPDDVDFDPGFLREAEREGLEV